MKVLNYVILPDKIILKDGLKVLTIEIKSGKSIDIFQVERYLIDSDVLLLIRVPTEEVITIDSAFIKNVDSVVEKAIAILRKELGTETR